MKDFDIREIEFEEDDLPVEGDFEDIEDELHNLCFATDEEGNEVPYFCLLDDIAMIYNLDEDEIIDIAFKNGYKVYSVFNTDTEEETLVVAGEGFGADEIKSVYEEMFEDEAFEVEELAQEDEEENTEETDESLKESKAKKTTHKNIKDVIEEILSEDFLGKKDTLSQEELDVIHSVINKRIRGLDNVINCLKEIKKQIGNKRVVRFFHYGKVMSLNSAINDIKNIEYLRYIDLTFDYRDDLIVVEFEQENLFV